MFYVQMYNVHKHNRMYMFVNITRLMIQTHTYLYYLYILPNFTTYSMVIP